MSDTLRDTLTKERQLPGPIRTALWMIAGGFALGVITLAFRLLFGLGGVLGGLLALALLISLAEAVRRGRARRVDAVVSFLEMAVRLNLPLVRVLQAAAFSERNRLGARLSHLCGQLQAGSTLAESLQATVPEMSRRHISLIDAGERTGQLRPMLARLVAEQRPAPSWPMMDRGLVCAYGLGILISVVLMISLLGIYIAPVFERIFDDFDLKLPASTVMLFSFMRASLVFAPHDADGGLPTFELLRVLAVAVTLYVAGRSLREMCTNPERRGVTGRPVRDWFCWHLPVLHGLALRRGLADALTVLARMLREPLPPVEAIHVATTVDMNRHLRHQLSTWRVGMEQGQAMALAARAAQLPALVTDMLASAEAAANVPSAVEFLADYYRSAFSRIETLIRHAAVPAMVLVLGTVVGWIAYGLIVPIWQILETMQ